jgi:hypothetical protein
MYFFKFVFSAIALLLALNSLGRSQSPLPDAQFPLSDVSIVDPAHNADIKFGPAVFAKAYTTREAVKWGMDFIVSPSRAKDRNLFYGYRLDVVDAGSLVRNVLTADATATENLLTAFVSEVKYGPLPMLGGDRGYYAAPILFVSTRILNSESFDEIANLSSTLSSRLVGVAALKGVGIDVSRAANANLPPSNAIAFVATTKAIPRRTPDEYFIIAGSAWLVPERQPALTWGINLPR